MLRGGGRKEGVMGWRKRCYVRGVRCEGGLEEEEEQEEEPEK